MSDWQKLYDIDYYWVGEHCDDEGGLSKCPNCGMEKPGGNLNGQIYLRGFEPEDSDIDEDGKTPTGVCKGCGARFYIRHEPVLYMKIKEN